MLETFAEGIYRDHVILVTGGTSGIGLATAELYAELGGRVIAVGFGADEAAKSRAFEGAVESSAGGSIEFRELDVTDDAALKELSGGLDKPDVLVPAAGMSLGDTELEWENFNRVLAVQLQAVYRSAELARPLLRASRGTLITVASMFAYFGGNTRVGYSAAKGGVVQLTKSL